MISMARTFGAPDSVPAGKRRGAARRTPSAPARSSPTTVETMCMTWLYRSTVMNSTTSTVPGAQTRPRSLRPRSTSMTCSARSFGSASSSAASAASSLGGGAARPGAGDRVRQRPARPLTLTSASGVEPTMSKPSVASSAEQVHVRAGVGRAQHPVDVERVGAGSRLEPLRQHDLEDLAGPDRLLAARPPPCRYSSRSVRLPGGRGTAGHRGRRPCSARGRQRARSSRPAGRRRPPTPRRRARRCRRS